MTQDHDHDFSSGGDSDPDPERDEEVFGAMPEEMHSLETGEPFRQCLKCKTNLTGGDLPYSIQKSYRKSEPVFEMAICIECASDFQKEISTESRQAIEQAFEPIFDQGNRLELMLKLFSEPEPVFSEWVGKCVLCAREAEDCDGRSVACHCVGSEVLYREHPFMVCDQCELSINEVPSKKTRDAWDRFVEQNLDCPPGIDQPLPERMPVLF